MFSYSLNSLIVFYEVVRLNSFSKAADMLFMTQPGVSNHVAQLEAQTGNRLIARAKGKCTLTKEGKAVFKYAGKIEATARGLEVAIRNMQRGEKQSLKVATTPIYAKVMVPFILGTFEKDNPDITIALDMGTSGHLMDSVLALENDVVIAAAPRIPKNLSALPLVREELVAIVPTNHPFSTRKSLSIRDMEGRPLIVREKGSATRNAVLSAFESLHVKPAALIDMKSTDFIKEWVSQGKGKSILIRRAVSADDLKHLRAIPLVEGLSLEVSLFFLKSRRHDVAIRKFVQHVENLKSKYVL